MHAIEHAAKLQGKTPGKLQARAPTQAVVRKARVNMPPSKEERTKALAEPLMTPSQKEAMDDAHLLKSSDTQSASAPLLGMAMVTAAALLFGVVAAFVKATALPTLVMIQVRSILEWAIGIGVALCYRRPVKFPRAEVSLIENRESAQVSGAPASPRGAGERGTAEAAPTTMMLLLLGPPRLWGWLVLRAFLYWGFLACWWLALTSMPLGDATTVVYCAPIFTASFARIFLGERIDASFYPIVALDFVGLLLITQPSFLFTRAGEAQGGGAQLDHSSSSYLLGACSALTSAVIAGLLPVTTRISKDCFWTAVNQYAPGRVPVPTCMRTRSPARAYTDSCLVYAASLRRCRPSASRRWPSPCGLPSTKPRGSRPRDRSTISTPAGSQAREISGACRACSAPP